MAFHHSPKIVTDGIVLCLDAANLKSAQDESQIWYDLSGRGNNGTLMYGASFQNNLISFGGSNDIVNFGNISDITTSYTIESWFNASQTVGSGDHNTYGFTLFASPSSYYAVWVALWHDEIRFWSFNNNASSGFESSGAVGISEGEWHCVSVSAIKGGMSEIYLNGALVKDFTNIGVSDWSDFSIGDLRPGRNICFHGEMGAVKAYNRVLSDREMLQNYNALKGRFGL